MQSALDWDDLRIVLAVGRGGSLAAAARALGVNHSTVFRRIVGIEERLGARLFDRMRDGYAPTPAGEAMIALAARVEGDVIALERKLAGEDLRPSGEIRVTTTETLVPLLAPLCAAFRRAQPSIRIDLIVGRQHLNLSRRDADVALRPTRAPPESAVGRRLAGLATAVYASQAYLAARPAAESPASAASRGDWIGFDDNLAHLASAAWLRRHVADERIALRSDSLIAIREAARASMGLALLPCFVAEGAPELRRVGEPLPELAVDLWLLTHEDLRHAARVRAFVDFVAAEIGNLRGWLEGIRPDANAKI